MRCRNASPSRPPEAKLSKTFKKDECSEASLIGIQQRIKNGAALMKAVEEMA